MEHLGVMTIDRLTVHEAETRPEEGAQAGGIIGKDMRFHTCRRLS
jgi:hypothetical protein